jgi:molybdopterin molybdotransferase
VTAREFFFKVKTPDEVWEILQDKIHPMPSETVNIGEDILGRVLTEDIASPVDLPGFDRAIMDGFAVRAKDTFGASSGSPAYLNLVGEVKMGETASVKVSSGQAVQVATGSMMPEGADAVVMVEHTDFLDQKTIEVVRNVVPGENMVGKTEDLARGEMMLHQGHVIRPQDIGALAGVGITQVKVSRQPRVAIISSGDEIVPPKADIKIGQIRDINSYSLSCLVKQAGGVPLKMGIVRDDFDSMKNCIREGLNQADIVLVSGGSSVGARDVTLNVIQSFDGAEVLVHGVSIRPGKPVIIARVGGKYLFGLPGNPVSVMVAFGLFVGFLIELKLGIKQPAWQPQYVKARLNRNVASVPGREDYISVRLVKSTEGMLAEPVLGKSALISMLVKADGLIKIPLESEGLEAGTEVDVKVFDDGY